MTPEARLIGNVLLGIHHELCLRQVPMEIAQLTKVMVDDRTIRYMSLFERAGVPFTRNCGSPLAEIAYWCAENKFPPLHSLAVNESGKPGFNYHNTPGWPERCDLDNWDNDVRRCIAFERYPLTI